MFIERICINKINNPIKVFQPKKEKLSIITINLNNCQGLQKTIESVINQTFNDFEYLVIDGGSIDKSIEVIKQYESKIKYWVSEPDKGIYNAINNEIVIVSKNAVSVRDLFRF